jgi:NADH:ubiquinone oxidoreductase subunit F (NADH-binding)/NADH:ubiquinone oxidoreductase subunit E
MLLVQRLREIQDRHGFLPDDELHKLSTDINLPLPKIQEVVSFFAHFRPEWDKPKKVEAYVCRDMACHLKGAPAVVQELKRISRDNIDCHIDGVSCLGRCDRAPALFISRHGDHHHHGEGDDTLHQETVAKEHNNPFAEGDRKGTFHEWVYAGRTPKEYGQILQTALDDGEVPIPDWDYTYNVNRNEWQIDPYDKPDDYYGAVRAVVKDMPNPVPYVAARVPKDVPDKDKRKWEEKFIADRNPWLHKLRVSELLGMGGAGMLAHAKWSAVWREDRDEKYIVCNGDESEPGTFKDRELLLRKPHLVVEGVILAGLMTNATRGFIFIRHEYPEQIKACRAAIAEAEAMGACGTKIFGSNRNFQVDVFVSPGGYICGEQTALIEAMESHRAQPRNRPPELMTNGLMDKPTVVNNVETLAWTPRIMTSGGDWYQNAADGDFVGRRIISISGDLVKPGVYEVKVSDTLQKVIQYAGDCTGTLKAVATSGPSGGLLPILVTVAGQFAARLSAAVSAIDDPDGQRLLVKMIRYGLRDAEQPKVAMDLPNEVGPCIEQLAAMEQAGKRFFFDIRKMPLDLNQFKAIGKLLGVGMGKDADMMIGASMGKSAGMMLGAGIVVYSKEGAPNMLEHALNFTEFFRNESCGKCVPCRLGSQKLVEIGTDLLHRTTRGTLAKKNKRDENGRELPGLLQQASLISDMSLAMVMTSICSLGQVAPNPLMTVLQYFQHEIKTVE